MTETPTPFPLSPHATLLVTGSAGFIGANFTLGWVKAGGWVRNGGTVISLDKLTYAGNRANLASLDGTPQHIFVRGDIGDVALVTQLLNTHKPAAIVNFAAESHVDRSINAPEDFIQTNVVGTLRLLEAARGYVNGLGDAEKNAFRFLHISTDEVYGSLTPDESAFTENHRTLPNSPYAASKAASDHLVRAYYHTYNLPVITTNCSNNYGPYQFPEKLIPLVISKALKGEALPIYGDGQNVRDWLYVGDHCAAITCVLEKGRVGEVYNIGGKNEMKNLDVVNSICDILDRHRPRADKRSYRDQIAFVKDRLGHDRRYAIDASKITRDLGWQPQETFASGIEKTVRWYLDNQAWVEACNMKMRGAA
jgi:dTDP-glucose 4,6-dehydratase